MNLKRSLSIATVAAAAVPSAAFSPSVETVLDAPLRHQPPSDDGTSLSSTTLHYKNYHSSYYENLDVDGDRMSLLSLLDPPAAPRSRDDGTTTTTAALPSNERTPTSSSRSRSTVSQRSSPVIKIGSIQDYHKHVMNEPNQMCVVRFSAPWCKVCKSTNVAWERMASKITKGITDAATKRIKFLAVSLDGKDEATVALKDMLQINRVPQGIVHHPTEGIFGQKVDLTRSNLSTLKKRLEKYIVDEEGEDSGMGMVLDGLGTGGGETTESSGGSGSLPL